MEQEKNNNIGLDELISQANDGFTKYVKDNNVKELIRAIGLFPDQTITNDVLILSQKPNATCVKRMKEWNFYRRAVKKSEKAIKVVSHYLDKRDVAYNDDNGNVITKGAEKLKTNVGYLFDISQTEGKEYEYLNSNKETIAAHFEAAKTALEKTARGFQVKYQDQEQNSTIDMENKTIFIKDGMSIDDVLQTLIDNVSQVLLAARTGEGLQDKEEFEKNAVIYAVNSKLGLDLPKYNFDVANLDNEGVELLKGNLQRVRSVTKQMLSNVESSIEHAVRNLEKKMADELDKGKEKEEVQKTQEEVQPEPKPKATRTRKKKESEVVNA